MFHSIIIPHRDYNAWLGYCLWSIRRSALICETEDYEVLVVDQGSRLSPFPGSDRVHMMGQPLSEQSPDGHRYFNKPRAQNAGIERARGDVISFIDADTLVGGRWMENVKRLDRLGPMALTKLCYRVRYLPCGTLWKLGRVLIGQWEKMATDWFERYEEFPRSREHYGEADQDPNDLRENQGPWDGHDVPAEPIFGNSQFSIRRDVLGELRFNEEYAGRGFEDLWMNRELWRRDTDGYRAGIVTDAHHALLQITNPSQGEIWGAGVQNRANFKRYYST
jgi:hypothetical protein